MLNNAGFRLLTSFSDRGLIASEMVHIFDVDDVLLHTRPLVEAAYEGAGVPRQMTQDNWGKAATEWVPKTVHDVKTSCYSSILFGGATPETTVLYEAARSELIGPHCMVLTAASLQSYNMLQQTVGFLPPVVATGIKQGCKAEVILSVATTMVDQAIRREIVFYDDSETEINAVIRAHREWPAKHKAQIPLYIGRYAAGGKDNQGHEQVTIFRADGDEAWTVLF